MGKSLLSSFKNDFNRTISVRPRVETKNSIGEFIMTRPTASVSGIKCLVLLRAEQYNKYIRTDIEYIKTTHKIRMDFGPTIVEGDKIKDNNNIMYDVKLVISTPGFDGVDDHLLVLCDIIK